MRKSKQFLRSIEKETKMIKEARGVRWVFTINNFTFEEEELIRKLAENRKVQFVIAEEEHLESGTPHIQGYIHLKERLRRKQMEQMLGGRAYVEIAKGTEQENIDYCRKEDQVIIEFGTPVNHKGHVLTSIKTDEDAKKILEDMRTLKEEDFEAIHTKYFLHHKNQVRDFRHEYLVKNQRIFEGNLKKKNLWIWGAPGTGKSRCARLGVELWKVYSKPYNKWWNGFDPECHHRVIIDDWPNLAGGGGILCQHLKIWADRYPFTAEIKGGHIAVQPDFQLIITSNFKIEDCFGSEEDKEAIRRRFTEIMWLGTEGTLDPYLILQIDE